VVGNLRPAQAGFRYSCWNDPAEVAQDTAVARQWRPERGNRVAYDGFVAMVGGPEGRYLPEHAHADLQITVRFGPRRTVQLVEPLSMLIVQPRPSQYGLAAISSRNLAFPWLS